MIQKSFIATILTLFFTFTTSLADDRENPLKGDNPLGSRLDKSLLARDGEQFTQKVNPQFVENLVLRLFRQRELTKLKNLMMERQGVNDIREIERDGDDPLLQLISDWMRREEMKRKRAHHRALCHFKICNMGTKRSDTWDVWPNDNEASLLSSL